MGLLSRLRAWLGGSSGDGESAEPTPDEESADENDDGETGLDPSAATETRTAATDDAVDALRDVRRSHGGSPADESVDEPDGAVSGDVDGGGPEEGSPADGGDRNSP